MTRREFEQLMAAQRPRLHRYCARMMGSAFDGEDVVQDALAKAAAAFDDTIVAPERWLFRIANHAAIDALRRARRQHAEEVVDDEMPDVDADAAARMATSAALGAFVHLAPAQRASVALIDVLGHSAAETGEVLEMSIAAVKAALHRGRDRLRGLAAAPVMPSLARADRERLQIYADHFNAHDWDALRALLAEDVRLELVDRYKQAGAARVGGYFTRYAQSSDWRLVPALMEDRAVLLVVDPSDPDRSPRYPMLIEWRNERIAAIRDFRYASHVLDDVPVHRLSDG